MAVDLMRHSKVEDQIAIQEAAAAGIHSMKHLIFELSHRSRQQRSPEVDCREITDFTVAKFKKAISLLNRTGHARFRRGPPAAAVAPVPVPAPALLFYDSSSSPPTFDMVQAPSVAQVPHPLLPPPQYLTLDFAKPSAEAAVRSQCSTDSFCLSPPMSSANSSFFSSLTGEGSVSIGKQGSSVLLDPTTVATVAPAAVVSVGKPPLSSSYKKKFHGHGHGHGHGHSNNIAKYTVSGARCHCSKKRKSRVKRTIRVPAISSKTADTPADEYSWRKYGQKPIKGSPYPRGYYRCSSHRGCPARKHVERAPDEPSMLIVTYEGEHRHAQSAIVPDAAAVLKPSSVGSFVFESS